MFVQPACVIAALLCAALGTPSIVHAGAQDRDPDGMLRSRFLSEYPAAFRKLKSAVDNVRCELHRKRDDYEAQTTYYSKDGAAQEIMRFADDPANRLPGYPLFRVNSFTAKYVFRLDKYEEAGPYVLKLLVRPSDAEGWEAGQGRRQWRIDTYLSAAYLVCWRGIGDIIDSPTFEIQEISSTIDEGREAVTVRFKMDDWSEYEELLSARIVLLPDLDWALKEYEVRSRILEVPDFEFELRRVARIQCRRWGDERRVLPKHVRFVVETRGGGKKKPSVMTDFADIRVVEFDSVTDEQFSLKNFGLPDIAAEPPDGNYPFDNWLFWVLICGLIASLAALLIRRRRHNKRPPHQPHGVATDLP